jgi:hypothetical protein
MATDTEGSSVNRLVTVQPPEPPPTTMKSNVSVMMKGFLSGEQQHVPTEIAIGVDRRLSFDTAGIDRV